MQCVFCLVAAYLVAKLAGYDVGSAVGLYAGSQRSRPRWGSGTDAINRLGLPPEETKNLLDGMPVACASAIFGMVSIRRDHRPARPSLLRINLEEALRGEARRQEAGRGARDGLAPFDLRA